MGEFNSSRYGRLALRHTRSGPSLWGRKDPLSTLSISGLKVLWSPSAKLMQDNAPPTRIANSSNRQKDAPFLPLKSGPAFQLLVGGPDRFSSVVLVSKSPLGIVADLCWPLERFCLAQRR